MNKGFFKQQVQFPRWAEAVWRGLSLALFVSAGLVKFGHGQTLLGEWSLVPEAISDALHGQPWWSDFFPALALITFWTIVFLAVSLLIAWGLTAIIVVPFAIAGKNPNVQEKERGS